MKISYSSLTDQGITREHNEDFILSNEKYGVFIVADGMGGYQGGDVASKTAAGAIIEYLDMCALKTAEFSQKSFKLAIDYANEKVFRYKESHPEIENMGTTFVSFVVSQNEGCVFNIGDSRLYQYNDKHLIQITKDHSAEKDVLPDFMRDPQGEGKYSSVLSRALGVNESVQSDMFSFSYSVNDILLLCSDGLYSMLSNEEIIQILVGEYALDKKCSLLIEKANENGGEDNISVILLEVNDLDNSDNIEFIKK